MSGVPRNILIVTHHFPPHITGVGMVAYNQAKRLVALGYAVTVVTSQTNHNEKSTIQDGIHIIRIKALNFSEQWGAPFPFFYPKLFPILRREIKKADIVHIHDAFYMSSFFAAVFAHWYKKPLVLTEHIAMIAHPSRLVVWIEKMAYATTGKLIFKYSDAVMVYNKSVKDFLVERGISSNKITVLFNGVDETIFHTVSPEQKAQLREKLGISKHKKVILFVGRFVYKKGFTKVLAAESTHYQIVFAGADPIQDSTDNLLFLGKMPPSAIAEAYQAADLFLLPSESEGFPLSIQEAMACGLPIITTDDEGYDDYALDRNKVCLISNPTDENVRQAVKDIIFNDTRLQEMGAYSKHYADGCFKWNSLIVRLEKIYGEVAEQKSVPKKLAFVSDAVYQFNKGGKEKRLYDLTTQLAQHGHDVTIYCMKWWEGPATIEKEGVKLCAITSYHPLYANNRRSIGQAIYFSLGCFKLLFKRFDTMDVDHIPHTVLFVTKFVCVLKRKKMIATWHEVWGKKYWREYLGSMAGSVAYIIEKISAMLPDTIVSVSPYTTAQLRTVLGVKKNIVTIPNALDIDAIQIAPIGTASDVIFAGRLLSHKNVDVLLQAIALLVPQHPSLKVLIIGEGPEKERLEALARTLQIERVVTFTGFLDEQEALYGLLKASKVFVLPSEREGFGLTVIEANAAGLPVITVNAEHNAAKDLIINNENGMVCELNPQTLAGTIETVLQSKKNAEHYMHFAEAYSWKNTIATIEKIYI